MKTSSAKAKGRRCAQEAREIILSWFPDLQPGDIQVTPSGVTGPDLYFSPAAIKALPIVIECKNQEAMNIWAALTQAQSHAGETGLTPALIFKRNKTDLHIAMRLEDFMRFVGVVKREIV